MFSSASSSKPNPDSPTSTTAKALPVLPVRDTVLFPHAVLPLTVGRESSIQLIESLGDQRTIVVVAQRDARQDSPEPDQLHQFGTLATVHKVVKMPNQSRVLLNQCPGRCKKNP
jgi:ATP-dependent Lon protease